jgi:hypothetical protein
MRRTAREFSTLSQARRQGFDLSGSGSGTVVSPRVYGPGRRYLIQMFGDGAKARSITVAAGRDGRLKLQVRLGPPNPYQQDTAQAQAHGTRVYTTAVTISRARRGR